MDTAKPSDSRGLENASFPPPVPVSHRKRLWPWLAAAALLLGGAGAWYAQSHSAPVQRYESVPLERGTIASRVTATGTLSARVTVQVGSQVSGRLQEIAVDYNAPVHKGQVLAKIDPRLFQAALEQARANTQAAEAALEKARAQARDAARQVARFEALAKQHFVPAADLETARTNADVARTQVTSAQAAVTQARAALHQAEINLAYTTILSPINGVVISRNVDVGQTVAASLQAPTLFVLAEDLRALEVHTNVAEADVGRLKPGMPADFTVDAFPARHFQGKVRQIRNAPQTVQNVVTYDAVIDVRNPERRLKPGMTANVNFVEAVRENVLRVPNAALRFKPSWANGQKSQSPQANEDGRRTVWVLQGARPKPVRVQTGLSDGSYTELLDSPLSPGSQVITEERQEAGARRGSGRMPRMF